MFILIDITDVCMPKHHIESVIPENFAGERLDKVLAVLWGTFSRAQLTRWIRDGSLLLDGHKVKPNTKVDGSEKIVLQAEVAPDADWHVPQEVPFTVLCEDADFLVIDKPAGVVVHPGAGNKDATLVNGLIKHFPRLLGIPRLGIVHRLDKDTSGVMVVAASDLGHTRLTSAIGKRLVERVYLGVCEGRVERSHRIDRPIGRDYRDRTKQRIREDGRQAITHISPLNVYRAHTLIKAKLETGRTHQVRVHLSSLKYPLVGDKRYGANSRLPSLPSNDLVDVVRDFRRQALHARQLGFRHPKTDEYVTFESPIPTDMSRLIAALTLDAKLAQ